MRDYIYKAKRINGGEWVDGYTLKSDRQCFIIPEMGVCCIENYNSACTDKMIQLYAYEVDPDTICMATEYTKENKFVFENDIIKYDDCLGIVKFGKYRNRSDGLEAEYYGFYIEWQEDGIDMLRKDIGFWMNEMDVRVIGNVFDNKNLLEEGN